MADENKKPETEENSLSLMKKTQHQRKKSRSKTPHRSQKTAVTVMSRTVIELSTDSPVNNSYFYGVPELSATPVPFDDEQTQNNMKFGGI